jgi:putative flippase GtrA
VKLLPPVLWQNGRRFFLFGVVGVVNTLVDFAAFSAALALGVTPALANILAFATANPLSYIINGKVTFRSASGPAALSFGAYAKFCAAHLVSLAISTGLVFWLSPVTGAIPAKLLAVAATLLINFLTSSAIVFGAGEKRSAEGAESP